MSATFTAALRQAVPAPARGLACICAACADRAAALQRAPVQENNA